eukprot:GHRR01026065.1.p1 GENE.GHRR01026065.1~~GHRR01026065.1.p1  ORF type:complete len:138 (+),score=20.99 GHRR01026065.1:523-936(+)
MECKRCLTQKVQLLPWFAKGAATTVSWQGAIEFCSHGLKRTGNDSRSLVPDNRPQDALRQSDCLCMLCTESALKPVTLQLLPWITERYCSQHTLGSPLRDQNIPAIVLVLAAMKSADCQLSKLPGKTAQNPDQHCHY